MSVFDGQAGSAAIFNAAFGSKTAANTYTGVQTLNAGASGPSISNLQLEINTKRFKTYSTQLITSGGTISAATDVGMQYRRIVGDPGATTLSSTPFGSLASMPDGAMLMVIGTNDAKPVTIEFSDVQYGCLLNGNKALGRGQMVLLLYDAVLERLIEIGSNV